VINADDFYGADAYRRMADWFTTAPAHPARSRYAMVGYPLRNTLSDHGAVNRGICRLSGNRLLSEVEEVLEIARTEQGAICGQRLDGSTLEIDGDTPVSMNFWGFTTKFLAQLETEFLRFLEKHGDAPKAECYIPTVVDSLIRSGAAECEVLDTEARWFGVTYPEDKPYVVKSIAAQVDRGEYPTPLV
jgi:hypothetical protein